MAEYRNDDERTLQGTIGRMNRTPEADPEHLLADHTVAAAVPGTIAGGASDPDAVRGEIERTRERMSSTIDQIEGALLRKKDQLQERLDIVAPLRERPWVFAAGVFGTGLALGLLTGGGDDDRDQVKVPRSLLAGMGMDDDAWTGRSRDLLQVVARQEEEIRDLRAALYDEDVPPGGYGFGGDGELHAADALGDVEVDDEWDEDWNFADQDDALDDFGAFGVKGEGGGFLPRAVAAAVAAGLAGVIGGVGRKVARRRGHDDELEVEVDLEPRGSFAGDGELDVEVGLERPYAGAYRAPSEYAYGQGGYGRELNVEVDLERPRRRSLPVSPLAGAVAAGAAALVGGLVTRLVRTRSHRGEMDVEVELEDRGSRAGFTSSPQPLSADREYVVELERPGGPPADPPLM